MKRTPVGLIVLLLLGFGCGSSSSPPPIDPVATDYCAQCSELANCERLISQTINAVCTDETRAWYSCMAEKACNDMDCDADWAAREACMANPAAELLGR